MHQSNGLAILAMLTSFSIAVPLARTFSGFSMSGVKTDEVSGPSLENLARKDVDYAYTYVSWDGVDAKDIAKEKEKKDVDYAYTYVSWDGADGKE